MTTIDLLDATGATLVIWKPSLSQLIAQAICHCGHPGLREALARAVSP